MAIAYIMINAETGTEKDVIGVLRNFKEVKEVHSVYGAYDIIARLEANTMEEIKNALSWKIRRLDKVRSTTTTIVA